MNKREMLKASNGDLIVEYVITASEEASNYLLCRGLDRIRQHRKNIEEELLKREILTEKQIRRANYEN